MGYSSIRCHGVFIGFEIQSENVIDFEGHKSEREVDEDFLSEMTDKLEIKFRSFLKKKFEDSIPKEFSEISFIMDYTELMANYEVSTYGYPELVVGYNMNEFIDKPKDLHSAITIDIHCSFPQNFVDILAEFYAEYKLKECRKKKKAKVSEESDETEESEDSEESDNEALPHSAVDKLKMTLIKEIHYGLHRFVC